MMNDVGFRSGASSLVLCVCTCGAFVGERRGKSMLKRAI